MELIWLEDFLTLAECRSFSQAAEQRHITQPAFSRRVRALETWIGTSLFHRDTHRVSLTPAGTYFRPVAEEIVRRVYEARGEAQEIAETSAHTLRFASTHALSLTFFPEWLRQMESRLPLKSPVWLVAENMAGCERIMLQGRAHFLLCHHHPAAAILLEPKQFQSIKLGEDVFTPISAPRTDGSGRPRHELPGEPGKPVSFLSYSEESGMGRIISAAQLGSDAPVWLDRAFTSHVAIVLITMAREGRGLAFSPMSLIADALASGELVRAGDESWDIPVEIRLFRSRSRQSPAVEDFWSLAAASPEHQPVRETA